MNILLVEDQLDHLQLALDAIDDAFHGTATTQSFKLLSSGLEFLNDHAIDIFLCDLKLPDSTIENTVETLQALKSDAAIVVLTSLDDTELARSLLQKGIQDYLAKEDLTGRLLYRACNYALERKQNQQRLEEKNRDYAAFCYSLSHDFKGLMNRMQRCAEIVLADHATAGDLEQSDMEMLNFIAISAKSAQKLVKELAVYLSTEVSNRKDMKDFDLFKLLEMVLEQNNDLIQERQAHIELADNLQISLQGNNAQLYLLFQNLIQNAIHYCKDAPQISIAVEKLNKSLNECVLSITDNGIGIDKQFIAEIFQPFKRMHKDLDAEGTGLGLSIVKRIVHNHAGSIEVKSQVGQGTTFNITLPLRQG